MRCRRYAGADPAGGENGAVIHDVDRSLAAWMGTMLPPGTTIRLDAPDPAWGRHPPEQPFMDVFLYDIAEDVNGLSADVALVRDSDGRPVAWQPQARRYRLSYLVTAWSADVPADHEMLASVMSGCADAAVIPEEFLQGTLAGAGFPVEVQCAPPREAREAGTAPAAIGTAGLCQALGGPPRAALVLALVAPLIPAPRTDVAPPARSLDLDTTLIARPADNQTVLLPGQPDRGPGGGPRRRWERARITERHT
jgi:hypothetical protein